MGSTAADRMKKYRERLKANPEKYEAKKKKHAAYVKSKTKKVAELSETEKEKKRKIWREQKRKQKEKKEQGQRQRNETATNASKPKKKVKNEILKKLRDSQNKVKRLITTINKYKQKLFRVNKNKAHLQIECEKLTARNEILEISLKNAFKKCNNNKEKNIIKSFVDDEKLKESKKKNYLSRVLGLKGKIRRSKIRTVQNKQQIEIQNFFVRDDISRMTSGKKECRTVRKNKRQIRYMTDTLFNLFKIYKQEGGKQSFSTFYKYKPFYVLSPNINNRETCLCVKHQNSELMFHALRKNCVLQNYTTLTDVLKALCCDLKSQECMNNDCEKCQNNTLQYNLIQSDKVVEWHQWERVDHTYIKMENGQKVEKNIKKTKKIPKTGTIETLTEKFKERLPAFKKHYFNWQHQQTQYQKCVKDMKTNEIFIICDFSENYQAKLADEIQASHFAKNTISLHTGMIYTKDASQSFCTISDDTSHDPAAIWSHLLPIIRLAKKMQPSANVLHVYSDGPSSQYRQKKNFYLLSLFTRRLGFEYSTWSYSEAGHGKGVADGIGGCIKRALDRQVSYGNDITDGLEAEEQLRKCISAVKCIYIPNTDFQNIESLVPKNLSTLNGTMKIHQIITTEPNTISYRNLSCFCGEERGLCGCYSPKIHHFNVPAERNIIFNTNMIELDRMQNNIENINAGTNISVGKEVKRNKQEEEKKNTKRHTKDEKHKENNEENKDQRTIEVEKLQDTNNGNKENLPSNENFKNTETIIIPFNADEKQLICDEDRNETRFHQQKTEAECIEITQEFDSIVIPLKIDEFDFFSDNDKVETNCDNIKLAPNLQVAIEISDDDVKDDKIYEFPDLDNTDDIENICIKEQITHPCSKNLTEKKQSQAKRNTSRKRPLLEENTSKREREAKRKSIKNVVSRSMNCKQCKSQFPFQFCRKCISCQMWCCNSCTGDSGNLGGYDDFICKTCFEGI